MTEKNEKQEDQFPIVGIGASAGGLNAFTQFIKALPDQPDMAFVLVQHLAPDHESELAELLQNHTNMSVTQVDDSPEVQSNHIYVIPPGKVLTVQEGKLYLSEPVQRRGHRSPIDEFFRSLAEDQRDNGVCIILSGTGSDGTLGLKAVKEAAGLTMAQDPSDAEYDGMPHSAIRTGLVDVVDSAENLAKQLISIRHDAGKIQLSQRPDELPDDDNVALNKIFAQLRSKTGHDFSHYKRATILRRISRRMQVNHTDTLSDYLALLRAEPEEAQALFKDFLISVTNFFRDPQAFDIIENEVIPVLFADKGRDDQVRVWVTGCATGEEAYSIAILLHEYAIKMETPPAVQVFATDIDEDAIGFARAAIYPVSIATDVSPTRLDRYFEELTDGYRVRKEIRDAVLFASHNLIKDPPFSRQDMISCRNLLIYLGREVQDKVFELFHYALRDNGCLFLGTSESADTITQLFNATNKKFRIYQKLKTSVHPPRLPTLPLVQSREDSKQEQQGNRKEQRTRSIEELYNRWTLTEHAPPRMLVNDQNEITHVFGGGGRFLSDPEGAMSNNVLQRIVSELRFDVQSLLDQARRTGERGISYPTPLKFKKIPYLVRVEVGTVRLDDFPNNLCEIIFWQQEDAVGSSKPSEENDIQIQYVQRLEEELQRLRERLQTSIEEFETSNEELKASNEELQSINEEMRSTTEELETGKEELQSMNEELVTVNQELKNKVDEANTVNSDLKNLINAINIGTIFLDRDLRIKRFTPQTVNLFHIIDSDIGRPFSHLSHQLADDTLVDAAAKVLRTLETMEREVQSHAGDWYLLRISPYRTLEERIEGVVITLNLITQLKAMQIALERRGEQQTTIAQLGLLAMQQLDLDLFLQEVCRLVSETLGSDYTKVLKLSDDRNEFLLRAGVGWEDGLVGTASVPNDLRSQAGYTLKTSSPVIVRDFAVEKRFIAPSLLLQHDVASGISVIIAGTQQPYGVLGTHSKVPNKYTHEDANFILAIANLVAQMIERLRFREERERLIEILDSTPDLVGMRRIGGEVVYLNRAWRELIGLEGDAAQYDALQSQPEWVRELIQDEVIPLATQEGVWRGQMAVYDQAGQEIPLSQVVVTHYNAAGEPAYRSSIARNISEIVEAQRAIEQAHIETATSLGQLESLYQTVPVGLAFMDVDMRYMRINQMLADINGMSIEAHIGRTARELFPELAAVIEPKLQQVITTHEALLNVEIKTPTPATDGRNHHYLANYTPVTDTEGTLIGINVSVNDITSLQEAEAEIRYQAFLLDHVREAIVATDLERTITALNRAAEKLYGWSEKEAVGRPANDVIPSNMSPAEIEVALRDLHETGSYRTEVTVQDRNGNPIYVDGITSAMYDEAGELQGFVSSARDITQRREVEAALRVREHDLQQLNESLEKRVRARTVALERAVSDLDQFTYIASHDLRTPLRAIYNLAAWITEDAADFLPAQSKEHLKKLRQRVERMENLLHDLLQYSRLGSVEDEIRSVDTTQLVKDIVEELIVPDGFNIVIDASLPTIETQPVPLALVLRNLIQNGIKHRENETGSVWISAESSTEFSTTFVVRDDGAGIDPVYHERIFHVFQTLQPRDRVEGSGVGLSIVKKIVEQRGGIISVASSAGEGATFRFSWQHEVSYAE